MLSQQKCKCVSSTSSQVAEGSDAAAARDARSEQAGRAAGLRVPAANDGPEGPDVDHSRRATARGHAAMRRAVGMPGQESEAVCAGRSESDGSSGEVAGLFDGRGCVVRSGTTSLSYYVARWVRTGWLGPLSQKFALTIIGSMAEQRWINSSSRVAPLMVGVLS